MLAILLAKGFDHPDRANYFLMTDIAELSSCLISGPASHIPAATSESTKRSAMIAIATEEIHRRAVTTIMASVITAAINGTRP